MSKLPAKMYYLIATGEVIATIITPESPYIKSTTKEEDIELYEQLKGKDINDIDYIELDYNSINISNVKSFKVNVSTKQLDIITYTQEELLEMQKQTVEIQNLNSRVSDISTYLNNSDEITITDIENSILESEKNKIINGGM